MRPSGSVREAPRVENRSPVPARASRRGARYAGASTPAPNESHAAGARSVSREFRASPSPFEVRVWVLDRQDQPATGAKNATEAPEQPGPLSDVVKRQRTGDAVERTVRERTIATEVHPKKVGVGRPLARLREQPTTGVEADDGRTATLEFAGEVTGATAGVEDASSEHVGTQRERESSVIRGTRRAATRESPTARETRWQVPFRPRDRSRLLVYRTPGGRSGGPRRLASTPQRTISRINTTAISRIQRPKPADSSAAPTAQRPVSPPRVPA